MHETNLIMEGWDKVGRGCYLNVEIIDELDSVLEVTSKDSLSNLDSLLDGAGIGLHLDVGFLRELLSSRGVAFFDEVVHNKEIHISICVSLCWRRVILRVHGCGGSRFRKQNICFLFKYFSERFPFCQSASLERWAIGVKRILTYDLEI